MKKIIFFVISLILILSLCSCKENKKIFYEERYTDLSYEEYFSEMRPVINYISTGERDADYFDKYKIKDFREEDENNGYYYSSTLENKKYYFEDSGLLTEDTVADIKNLYWGNYEDENGTLILENVKNNIELGREIICLTLDNKIYSIDAKTGEKYVLYSSDKDIRTDCFDATPDLIMFTSENTVYRMFRPTGQIDKILELDIDESSWLVEMRGNMLFSYLKYNSEIEELWYLDENDYTYAFQGYVETTENAWAWLIKKRGEEAEKLKAEYESRNETAYLGEVLNALKMDHYIKYIYDSKKDETYRFYFADGCPCSWNDICDVYYVP